jgi:hypothetical protein
MRKTGLDPAEEWLCKCWLRDVYSLYRPEEITSEIKEKLCHHVYGLFPSDQRSPPFKPETLFSHRKVLKKIETLLPPKKSGFLVPTDGGFILKVNSIEPYYRKRFTMAHEIGHTFFYDLSASTPAVRFASSKSSYWIQEGYANEIAETILLPEFSLRQAIIERALSPSIKGLEYLSPLYAVSYDVLTHRIIQHLGIWDCVIFKCTIANGDKVRVSPQAVAKGPSFKELHIPRISDKDYPLSSVLLGLIKNAGLTEKISESEVELKGSKYSVQSKLLNSEETNSYIVLLSKCE